MLQAETGLFQAILQFCSTCLVSWGGVFTLSEASFDSARLGVHLVSKINHRLLIDF
jgi:hypothetical protein